MRVSNKNVALNKNNSFKPGQPGFFNLPLSSGGNRRIIKFRVGLRLGCLTLHAKERKIVK